MGWTGTVKRYKTNLENVKYEVLYGKTENEKQWYKGLSQKGSNVFILGQNKDDKKYWVDCIMCQSVRRSGYSEFMYKGIGAVENMCFDFPKTWVELLDKTDPDVVKYIEKRNEYELKKKTEHKAKIGDLFKCTCKFDLNWSSHTIEKGKEFYVRYTDYYGHKYFLICNEQGINTNMKISRKTFSFLDKEFLKNG